MSYKNNFHMQLDYSQLTSNVIYKDKLFYNNIGKAL